MCHFVVRLSVVNGPNVFLPLGPSIKYGRKYLASFDPPPCMQCIRFGFGRHPPVHTYVICFDAYVCYSSDPPPPPPGRNAYALPETTLPHPPCEFCLKRFVINVFVLFNLQSFRKYTVLPFYHLVG